ncbi:gaf sensor signal transduction histidine kinase [Melioribacter roseus P3M-2]|uniref:histidine kinase n=1 Tax=Melioribacter roseus (strain DSM 23840 / JCM 17771 / VKM B-2668 / P3M-2) TaxID=1191523 RepID=I7A240_MELRP|nr:ATP-binding protein [Melioribacter roseus]AFN73981.1 gaf sensor signal transduction histidine kinase [Melioribacter roseus P3M-2]
MENQLISRLSKNKLLKNADISKIDPEKIKGKLFTVNEGEYVYKEGEPADSVYLIISGKVNLIKKKLLGKSKAYLFEENDFFGQDEILEGTSRTTIAVALSDSYLIALSKDEIEYLLQIDENVKNNLTEQPEEEETASKATFEEESSDGENSSKTEEFFMPIDDKQFPGNKERTNDLTSIDFPDEKIETKEEEKKEDDFDFDLLLDEDGIPKPESELPDNEEFAKENLDETIFDLLTGHDETLENEAEAEGAKDEEFIPDVIATSDGAADEKEENKVERNADEFENSGEEFIRDGQPDFEVPEPENTNEGNNNTHEESSIEEENKMDIAQLKKIIKAAELVNSTVKIDEVLKNIVEAATDIAEADRGTLYLIDKEKNELWSLIAMGKEIKEIRLKIGEGMAGYVAKTGEILNIKDVSKDIRYRSDFDKASGYETKNALTFPIKNREGEIIGVLQLLNSKHGEFSKDDEEILNAMSIHAAIALQNAEMVERLLKVERVQSLGKMANFLIQDIKKPILVSKRYAEHLRNKDLTPDNIQIIDMLLEQLNHVADLVQTTSSYSEGKAILRTMNISLNKTLNDYASRIGTYVESRNCSIKNEFDKDVTVKIDVKEFYQCYTHIIKNACDAMPDGGTIEVMTKRDDKNGVVKILIRDYGLGIADSLKEKIFEPFFTQGKKEGAGLGLSITKQIVEAHNGKIEVESSLGEGTTVIITIPYVSGM